MVSTYNCIGKVLQWIRKTPQRVATHGYVRVWKSVQATDHSHSKPLVLHLDPLIPKPDCNITPLSSTKCESSVYLRSRLYKCVKFEWKTF